MKRNIKLIIAYDGTRYNGWQRQGNTNQTIQEKIEQILFKMSGEEIELHGSGRTDAGVHAKGQTANFITKSNVPVEQMKEYINQYLPEDIAVLDISEEKERFHARLNAVRKTYVYRIWNAPVRNVFRRRFTTWIQKPLDLDAMEQAAALLCGTHDYRAFCSLKKFKKSTVRTIEKIEIGKMGQEIRISYTGDGFLYHMVRILTGTLVEVGLGLRKPDEMTEILEGQDRSKAGRLMPPEGLTLESVEY